MSTFRMRLPGAGKPAPVWLRDPLAPWLGTTRRGGICVTAEEINRPFAGKTRDGTERKCDGTERGESAERIVAEDRLRWKRMEAQSASSQSDEAMLKPKLARKPLAGVLDLPADVAARAMARRERARRRGKRV